jgi:hypothetical protein
MSSNKQLMEFNERLLAEVQSLKKIIEIMRTDINLIKEVSNLSHAKVSNLSSKIDLNISTLNITSNDAMIKSPAATSTGVVPKRKPNIMNYAKTKFKTDPELIYSVVGKKNVDALFEKFKKELNDKKSGKKDAYDTFKAKIVYENLIQKNKDNLEKLKNIKEQEEEGENTPSTEITENNSPLRKEIVNSDVEDESIADTADVNDDASSNNSDSD